jgi:hypothetical protein
LSLKIFQATEERHLEALPYFFCHRSKFFSVNLCELAEMWQFLPFKPWYNMDVQVEDVVACGFAVLLDDAYAVGVCGCFDGG